MGGISSFVDEDCPRLDVKLATAMRRRDVVMRDELAVSANSSAGEPSDFPCPRLRRYIAGGWWGSTESVAGFGAATLLTPPGLTESRSSFDALKKGPRLAGTSTRSPVLGLRPMRELRWRVRKLPKPRISILSPAFSAPMTDSKSVSTIISPSRRVRSPRAVTLSTRSAFVIAVSPCSKLVNCSLLLIVDGMQDFG